MNHEYYMQRALQLAKNGLGSVSPNPMVGCVIVHNDVIIGEGWHQIFGEAHAEVHAINAVQDKNLLKEATVYITLEPCSYYGKTPACSDLLIYYNVKKVVISALDPNPKVAGNGIKALNAAGIQVEQGSLSKESIELNKRFFVNQKLNRPYVILKWAQTNDGFMARTNFDSKWISNEYARQQVHQWRAEEDAILVGKNTAKYDNPSLTVRDWVGDNPLRVLLDRNLELDTYLNLFNGKVETLVYNFKESKKNTGFELVKLDKNNFVSQVLANLYDRNIGSLFIEGGSKVLCNFIQLGLWDEARVFTSQKLFKKGIDTPNIGKLPAYKNKLGTDELAYYFNPKTQIYWQKN